MIIFLALFYMKKNNVGQLSLSKFTFHFLFRASNSASQEKSIRQFFLQLKYAKM